jgi:hypothetical protein
MISQTKKRRQRTNAPTLLAILMAMQIGQYNPKHITHDGRSRATLDVIIRHHWAGICPYHPEFRRKKSSCGVLKPLF